tara:strand:+ start:62908 stop:65199 length:2292 start_codon:yes stop_codon:yes gene_type:complete
MKLISKAETLKKLKLKKSIIPDLKIYSFKKYFENKNKIIKDIENIFRNYNIAIRSSFTTEDTNETSNAGKYESYLNIKSNDYDEITSKINKLSTLKKNIKSEYFFVQKMVQKISFSGVVLTRNLEDYSKCLNINYFDGKNTDTVTSGKYGTKSIIFYENKKYKIPKKFNKLRLAIKEIIFLTKERDLDVEFAVDTKKRIYILQVRKLIVNKQNTYKEVDYKKLFFNLEKKINKLKQIHHDLLGKTTYFGNMPDWNPAEIIGTKPRPLALSLYQELITDHVWSKNRIEYGYRDLSQFHLMTTFFGTPYIDVRIDFNSWIPKDLSQKLSEKITSYYLNKFNKKTSLHDKIEFEILFTCATFTTKNKLKKELRGYLNKKEIDLFYKSLKKINLNALIKKKRDISLIEELKKKQEIIEKSNLYEIDKIYWLIEDCKKYGTLAFAGLARCGFIAIELLNSMVKIGAIKDGEKQKFLSNVKTINVEMKYDLKRMAKNKFIKKYGHLRPGTYDINSKNYKENFKNYFGKIKSERPQIKEKYKLEKNINALTGKLKIYKNVNELIEFIKESIAYREYSKFIFSKSIDLIFENLKKFGKKYNIKVDDLSYLNINKILNMYFNLSNYNTIDNLKKHIHENKNEYHANKSINLPDVIKSSKDLFVQIKDFDKINYISDKKITSKVIKYESKFIKKSFNGIVCIENADPGYDFLFNKNIKGLVTKYGGLNSHMAIRCSELNLPALIGVGEKNYNIIKKCKLIKIDCIEKKLELIN